jgi:hypothetical protein
MKWLGTERRGDAIYVQMKVKLREVQLNKSGGFQVRGSVAIQDKDGHQLVQEIGAGGRLLPWMEAWPATVNIGAVRAGQTVHRKVRFQSRTTGDAEVYILQP